MKHYNTLFICWLFLLLPTLELWAESFSAKLFFSDPSLIKINQEQRQLDVENLELASKVDAIFAGLGQSANPNFISVVPSFIRPSSAALDDKGTLYLNFQSSVLSTNQMGPAWEQRMIEAITSSLVFSIASVKRVKFLADGKDHNSFSGHFYTMHPIIP